MSTNSIGPMATAISLLVLLAIAGVPGAYAQGDNYATLNAAPAGEYLMDKTHGYVTFTYSHMGFSKPYLRFRDIDATLTLNNKDVSKSALSVTIAANSIDSGVDEYDEHLRDKDYFAVEEFPSITFNATDISEGEDGKLSITGDLAMKGVTKPVTLAADFNKGAVHFIKKKPALGFSARGTLKRSDWGMGKYAPMVSDEVELIIEVEFLQGK